MMMVVAVAGAIKTGMDAKRQAAVERKNAIARQKMEQEQLLQQRAEQGDADAMKAFEKSRAARVDAARIKVAGGEQGASTGNFQIDTMLQGLGFGTGLQNTADARSATNNLKSNALAIRATNVNFTNNMNTINSQDPSGLDIVLGAGASGANAFASAGGKFSTTKKTTTTPAPGKLRVVGLGGR